MENKDLKIKVYVNDKLHKAEKKGLHEFSKIVIVAMIIVWFVGALFGCACVTVQLIRGDYMIGLSELLAYIGAPMTGGIIGYMLKSGFENKEKIKHSAPLIEEGFPPQDFMAEEQNLEGV